MHCHTFHHMDNARTYGATIETAMVTANMNKKQLADTIGVSPATIQNAITETNPRGGKLTPYPSTLMRIADALRIDPGALLLEAGVAEVTVRELLGAPPASGLDLSGIALADQVLLKRIADRFRDQEK